MHLYFYQNLQIDSFYQENIMNEKTSGNQPEVIHQSKNEQYEISTKVEKYCL